MYSVWAKELDDALKTGHFSRWAFENSGNFETCAVGERSLEIFATLREPAGPCKAWGAGLWFHAAVQDDNVEGAVKLFKNDIRKLTAKDWRA